MKRYWVINAIAVASALATLATAQPAMAAENWVAWQRQFGTRADERAAGVAADAFGNVYAAGYEDPPGVPSRIAVWRFTARGGLVWKRLVGPGRATECAVDRWGKLYVVGRAGQNVFVKKLGPAGDLLFDRRLVATDTGIGGKPALAVRSTAWGTRVIVVGGRKCQAWAISLGGSMLASAPTTGTSADDVAVSPIGDVFTVGTSDWTTPPLPNKSYLRRLDANMLSPVWTHAIEDPGGQTMFIRALSAGHDSIYAGGYRSTVHGGWAVLFSKYDASGIAQWTREVYGSAQMHGDELIVDHSVVLDGTGAYVTMSRIARSYPAFWTDVYVRKYSLLLGAPVWRRAFAGSPPPSRATNTGELLGDAATDAIGRGAGNLYISGSTRGSIPPYVNSGGEDAVLFKMAR
jgi:hypothetical protein